MLLSERLQTLARRVTRGDEQSSGVGNLLSLNGRPSDDAVSIIGAELFNDRYRDGDKQEMRDTDYWRRAGRVFCSRGF